MCKLTLFSASSFSYIKLKEAHYSLFLYLMYIGNMDQIINLSLPIPGLTN